MISLFLKNTSLRATYVVQVSASLNISEFYLNRANSRIFDTLWIDVRWRRLPRMLYNNRLGVQLYPCHTDDA